MYGQAIKTLPYALNTTGDFAWINPEIGAVSSVAWYIFAKNGFNPLALKDINQIDSVISTPETAVLYQNYPNPFNGATKIKFILKEQTPVCLEVFNVLGQRIALLLNNTLSNGQHEIEFSASTHPSGIYLYRLQTGQKNIIKKMILIK